MDFGSGSGNLVLPLAHLLPDLEFIALDMKSAAIDLLKKRAQSAGLANVHAQVGYIEDFQEDFGIALGLHVCGRFRESVSGYVQVCGV